MTKEQFLHELNRLLQKLPEAERNDILYDYQTHIQAAVDNGKTEEEAILDLGSPQTIANEVFAMTPSIQDTIKHTKSPTVSNSGIGRGLFVSLGLILFNVIFVLGPVIGIAGVFIGLYAVSFACLVSPIGFIINLFTRETPLLLAFFVVLAVCSFGYLFFLITNYMAKYFIKWMKHYLIFNLKIIKGGY